MHKRNEYIHFKPTNQNFTNLKDFQQAHSDFFNGDLTEEFVYYCADQALHAFWINYKAKQEKIDKEVFNKKFKELINAMLKEI